MNYIKLDTTGFATNSLFDITTPLLAKTVKALGYDQDRLNFINESYQRFIGNPFDFVKMDQATYIVKKAIINQEKILLYSSYSPDGIYSLAMVSRVFNGFGANYGKYVPNRFIDGKQLNEGLASTVIRKGYRVVICLDNGLHKNPAIEKLRDCGVEVIVIDAHKLSGESSRASATINSAFKSKHGDEENTTTILTYKFVKALIGYDDDYYMSLVGLSIVDNHLPLINENYHFLKRALYLANNKKFAYISNLAKKDHFVNEGSFRKINNVIHSFANMTQGNDINRLAEVFTDNEQIAISGVAPLINKYKREYRNAVEEVMANARIESLNECVDLIYLNDVPTYFIDTILDNHYAEKQTLGIVVDELEDGNYKFKFIEDSRITSIIKDYKKGGLHICSSTVDAARKDEIIKELKKITFNDEELYLIEVNEEDLDFKGVSNLIKYGPYGIGNVLPWYLLKGVKKDSLVVSVTGEHLTGKLNDKVYLAAYNQGAIYDELDETFSIVFKPTLNYFNEEECVSLNIKEFVKEGK